MPGAGIEWREVPAGDFTMGSDSALEFAPDLDESPRHRVECAAFRIGLAHGKGEYIRRARVFHVRLIELGDFSVVEQMNVHDDFLFSAGCRAIFC